MKTASLNEMNKNLLCEDVPNLGSIITLDNKGRLINSQFSKPSSSQSLLKLNSTEELPDADDLPYAIISYGDTPNVINLPYNDHNYVSVLNAKKFENYDRKALDYLSKQSSQSSNRHNFPTTGPLRISHFSSYNTTASQGDAIFFGDKYKSQHQFAFNQQISHASTPIVTNKTVSNLSQNNNFYSKNKPIPNTIVINSGPVNKIKAMNVIQLRRPTMDAASKSESRIINLPMKKPSVLTNIMGNNQINVDRDLGTDKTDLTKSINLIPRCVCGFTHDDGGMIRCEICRTWQHIVCMYPDNKFPIYYKCERCEPRNIDINRAITTQSTMLLKTGYNPSDFVVHRDYHHDYDFDNDLENNFVKSTVGNAGGSHFVIVKPEQKNTVPNTSLPPIFITAASNNSNAQTLPPGSPRTSKRKQDLISLKTVLGKPPLSVNLIGGIGGKMAELPKPLLLLDTPNNYAALSGYFVPTSSHKLLSECQQESSRVPTNEMSTKLRTILSTKLLQYHTNLTGYHLQYLKQNGFLINTNMYELVLLKCDRYAVKAVVEFNASEVMMEYNGYVCLADEYNKEFDFRKHYNPFVLFYDKYDHIQLCIDAKVVDNKAKYVRRSCTPNAEVKHRFLQDGQIRFYVVPINRIFKDSEITIGFDYNIMKCRYPVECACNQPSCQLIYLNLDSGDSQSQRVTDEMDSWNVYDCDKTTLGIENMRSPLTMTRPYKKRGRGARLLNSTPRPVADNSIINVPKASIKIVRRNKRGRPPLNRSMGIQRTDAFVKPPSDSASNNNLSDFKDLSDNEVDNSQSNENVHPRMAAIHTNFKNFKRISSSHWSLKTNRKIAAITKKSKPLKKLLMPSKVGRPMKVKKLEVVEFEQDAIYISDHSHLCKPTKLPVDEEHNSCSDENYYEKLDLSRDDEGKYWLEEINNKILKQKAREAKRIQRKSKYNRKKMNQKDSPTPITIELVEPDRQCEPEKELKEENISHQEIEEESLAPDDTILAEEKNYQILKKAKRGRKSQKANTSYILSYKPSNIDDLKNDLMLISASFEEDNEKDVDIHNNIEEECEIIVDEAIAEENVNTVDEPSFESLEPTTEKSVSKDSENEINTTCNVPTEERLHKTKNRRSGMNKSHSSGRDMSTKASREERWVNTMWQRILKSEHSDDKSKRKRNKSSAAEESIASEDNRNESSEIGSPKMGNSELSEDRDSSSNSKSSSAHKIRRKLKPLSSNECDNRQSEPYIAVKFVDSNEVKHDKSNAVSMTSSGSVDEHQLVEHKETSEQCGLIVYKEQFSNPMEKFSRENSAKLFTSDSYTEGVTVVHNSGNVNHPPHTKKRWLSQALMDETFIEEMSVPKLDVDPDQDINVKLSTIDKTSKRSFLPPVFTSIDSTDLSTPSVPKIAINPKKRLINQFSMEDSALRNGTNVDLPINLSINKYRDPYKLTKSDLSNTDQEQAKIKLSLTEYRKRRFVDKGPKAFSNVLTKYQKNSDEFNDAWVGLGEIIPKTEKITNEESDVSQDSYQAKENQDEDNINTSKNVEIDCNIVNNSDPVISSPFFGLSYLDTLNKLPMPSNLDPRLSKLSLLNSSANTNVHDLRVIHYYDAIESVKKDVSEPKSPCDTPKSVGDENLCKNGPRTPSENGDPLPTCTSVGHQSEGSVHSFESQPSPTSDSHFDFDKDAISALESDKPAKTSSPWPSDWMYHTTTIGKVAGIKNPDLLQEIEEFEDEYIPMPENLPERTKEEMETLLLTQKRDSQIREWQEVKQLEREKVKLDHQVRSMERRLHRANKPLPTSEKSHNSVDDTTKNTMANYDAKNDEKTMKAFNVQLASINGRLMAQINSLKSDGSLRTATTIVNTDCEEESQLATEPCVATTTTTYTTKNSRRRTKKPVRRLEHVDTDTNTLATDSSNHIATYHSSLLGHVPTLATASLQPPQSQPPSSTIVL